MGSTPPAAIEVGQSVDVGPEDVRKSPQRREEIQQYLTGLLPARVATEIEVVIAPIETACVLPASRDAIDPDAVDGDAAEVRQLIDQVDADYVVAITRNKASIDEFPTDDQLTADRVHQYGLALHELLHILKTSFGPVVSLVEDHVDEQHQDLVHELINIAEDGAIEYEAVTGDAFSRNAAAKLLYLRQIYNTPPDPDNDETLTLGDAIITALHDFVMVESSGATKRLVDPADTTLTFNSDAARSRFIDLLEKIDEFATDILLLRGDDTDGLYKYDRTASLKRAKRTIQFYDDVIKPLVDSDQSSARDTETPNQPGMGGDPRDQHNSGGSESPDPGQQSDQDSAGEDTNSSSQSQNQQDCATGAAEQLQYDSESSESNGSTASQDSKGGDHSEGSLDSSDEDFSLNPEATDSPLQSIEDHPDLGVDGCEQQVDPDDLPLDPDGNQDQHDDGNSGDNCSKGTDPEAEKQAPKDGQPNADAKSSVEDQQLPSDTEATPGNKDADSEDEDNSGDSASEAQSFEKDRSEGTITTDGVTPESFSAAGSTSSGGQQAGLGAFASKQNDGGQPRRDESPSTSEVKPSSSASSETAPQPPQSSAESDHAASPDNQPDSEGQSSEQTDQTDQPSSGGSGLYSERINQHEQEDGRLGGEQSDDDDCSDSHTEQSFDPDQLLSEDVFNVDRRRADEISDEIAVDTPELEAELSQLDDVLEHDPDVNISGDTDQEAGIPEGSGAGEGSVDTLTVLPEPKTSSQTPPQVWTDLTDSTARIEQTLSQVLDLAQRDDTRGGLTAGDVREETAYRLSYGDPRTFEADIPGDDRRYFLGLVLDRSGSMRGDKIKIATSAVVQLALAAENVGIDVAVIDFVDGEARLVKPVSVSVSEARDALLSHETAGGTPLSDSLQLAKTVERAQSRESLLVAITDDQPAHIDAVIDEITTTATPICSVTIATDRSPESPSGQAQRLAKHYDRTETVYEPAALVETLDQFVSLLAGF